MKENEKNGLRLTIDPHLIFSTQSPHLTISKLYLFNIFFYCALTLFRSVERIKTEESIPKPCVKITNNKL